MSEYISNLALVNHIRDDLKQLSQSEKLAAVMLASRRNAYTLQCNPSFNRIALDMGVSRRTSITAINGLIKKCILVRFKDKYRSNHYLFYWDLKEAIELYEENADFAFTEEEMLRHLKWRLVNFSFRFSFLFIC